MMAEFIIKIRDMENGSVKTTMEPSFEKLKKRFNLGEKETPALSYAITMIATAMKMSSEVQAAKSDFFKGIIT
jgi:hypothetical protein